MTMFGRDSIFTSLQALPFAPELAATTLRVLGDWQGNRVDDFRDEDPGRILHEIRYGELTAFEERPHSPYYGTADATPLYVVLLDEYERWTGDAELVREFEHEARAALRWIDEYADLQGNGYIVVPAAQQGDRPGEPVLEGLLGLDLLPRRPAARLPASHLRAAGLRLRREDARRPPGTAGLERPRLRRRAGAARPPTSRSASTATSGSTTASTTRSPSTPTAARWTRCRPTSATCCGAASSTPTKAGASPSTCWARGCSPAGACAPWPRARPGTTRSATTSARSGRSTTRSSPGACAGTASRSEAARIAAGILDAAEFFQGRLPEAFGGYDATLTKYPGRSTRPPAARRPGPPARRCCFLRTMLGLEPVGDHLVVDPALPVGIGRIELLDIPGRWGRIDAFGRGLVDVGTGAGGGSPTRPATPVRRAHSFPPA